jgi:hypothetical protein
LCDFWLGEGHCTNQVYNIRAELCHPCEDADECTVGVQIEHAIRVAADVKERLV